MAARPLLYSMPISHYCISADRMLAFKGVPSDTRYVPYHDKSELIKATGQDYVPTLVWDGKPVMWYDIPDFLEKAQPKPTLYPWARRASPRPWNIGGTRSSRNGCGGTSSRKSRPSSMTTTSGGCSRRCRPGPGVHGTSSRCAGGSSAKT